MPENYSVPNDAGRSSPHSPEMSQLQHKQKEGADGTAPSSGVLVGNYRVSEMLVF